jgi:hypothetical protein
MKLVMTLLVRDELDIIESNIDFHLAQGVDFIVAMDNLSVDGTTDLLRAYEQRGVLYYLNQPDDIYAQGEWVTTMARIAAAKFNADWIINNDADEFWWPENRDLKSTLEAVDASCQAIIAERTNFIPQPDAEDVFFADRMTIREKTSLNALAAPLPGKVCHRALSNIEVAQGNHAVLQNGDFVSAISAPITILHFPMRSYRQFANKVVKGGAAYARNKSLARSVGETWRWLYELWQRDELETYYRTFIRDQEALIAGLKDGSLIFDDRLKKFYDGRPSNLRGPDSA